MASGWTELGRPLGRSAPAATRSTGPPTRSSSSSTSTPPSATRRRSSPSDLLTKLNNLEESPWGDRRRGEGLDARGLATLLRPFKIRPRTVRIGEETAKGYNVDQFADTFGRYLPEPPLSVTSVTSVTTAPQSQADVTDVTDVTDAEGSQAEYEAGADALGLDASDDD